MGPVQVSSLNRSMLWKCFTALQEWPGPYGPRVRGTSNVLATGSLFYLSVSVTPPPAEAATHHGS